MRCRIWKEIVKERMITSVEFSDGQNLNLAIPVSIIEDIKTMSPMSLNDLRKIESKGILIVAVEPDFYPYSVEKNGEFFGLHIDIAEEIAARNGYVAEYVAADWGKLFTGIDDGSYNLALGIEPTSERQQFYDFTDIYYDGMAAIFNVKNLDMTFEEWSQFKFTIRDMVNDGTIAAMLKYYNLSTNTQ